MNLRRGRGIKWVGVVAPPSLLLSELVMELKALNLRRGRGIKWGPSFPSTVGVGNGTEGTASERRRK